MQWSEMVAALGHFGLSEREAELYLTLLRKGRGTARELTRERDLDRVLGYRLLEGLRERGILQMTSERPRRYVPIAPKLLFAQALQQRESELATDQQLAERLASRLPELIQEESAAPRFQILTGGAMLYPTLGEMVARAKERVSTMITRRALRDTMRFGLHRRFGNFLASGGRFQLIVEQDPLLQGLLERFARATRDFPKAEIRQIAVQPTRMTVVDGREVLLYLVPETRNETEELAIWTNTPEFVRGHQIYFDGVWKRCKAVRAVP